jgi:hypothetical protein
VRFICCAHLVKSWAESSHAAGDLRRKHFGRQRFLDDLVPLWIPRYPTELDLLHVDRGWRGWLDGLRMRSCGYCHAKCETHDKPRSLQHKDTHVQPPPQIGPANCHSSRGCSALGSDREIMQRVAGFFLGSPRLIPHSGPIRMRAKGSPSRPSCSARQAITPLCGPSSPSFARCVAFRELRPRVFSLWVQL